MEAHWKNFFSLYNFPPYRNLNVKCNGAYIYICIEIYVFFLFKFNGRGLSYLARRSIFGSQLGRHRPEDRRLRKQQ